MIPKVFGKDHDPAYARVKRFLAEPGECELPAKSTAVLALQWRRLPHQAETLD
jgi:hypothetical protein